MEELKIELTYNPQYFREIYYQNGQGSVFTYKPTRKAIIYLFCVIILIGIIYFVSFQIPAISWFLILGFAALLFAIIYASVVITEYLRWKIATEAYIKGFAQFKSFNIHLTSSAIEFTQDSTITIDKWDSIKSVRMFENYLTIHNGTEMVYFIPAKSMKSEEFIKLKDFIATKIKTATE